MNQATLTEVVVRETKAQMPEAPSVLIKGNLLDFTNILHRMWSKLVW